MSQAKTLTVTAAALAVALVPLGMQRTAIAKEKRTLASLEQKVSNLQGTVANARGGAAPLSALPPKGRGAQAGAALSRKIVLTDWLEEFEAFQDGGDLDKIARVTEMLNSLRHRDRDELAELLGQVAVLEAEYSTLQVFVAQVLCEKIASTHLDLALDAAFGFDVNVFGNSKGWITGRALGAAAESDPTAAVDAYFEAAAAVRFPPADADGQVLRLFRDPITSIFFSDLYDVDETEAARLFAGLNPRDQKVAVIARTKDLAEPSARERLFGYVRQIPDTDQRRWSLGVMAENLGREDGLRPQTLALVREMGAKGDLTPEHAANLIVAATKQSLRGPEAAAEGGFAWIAEHSPPEFVEINLAKARELRASYTQSRQ